MGIQHYSAQYTPTTPIVDPKTGIPNVTSGRVILALFNRTGGGTGIVPKVSGPLVATGTSVINALGLAADWNLVVTTPPGSGVMITSLLNLQPGNSIIVFNLGVNGLLVYPPADFKINFLAIGNPYTLAPNTLVDLKCWTLNPNQLYTA